MRSLEAQGRLAVPHLAFDERVVNGARGGVAELARKQGALVLEAALAPLALGPAGPGAHLARPCKGAQPPPAPRGRIPVMAPEGAADVMRWQSKLRRELKGGKHAPETHQRKTRQRLSFAHIRTDARLETVLQISGRTVHMRDSACSGQRAPLWGLTAILALRLPG